MPELSANPVRSAADIRTWIIGELSKSLNTDAAGIDTAAPLDTLGVDSLTAIGMTGGLSAWLNRDLPATLMWDYTTIDALADGLADPSAAPREWPGVVNLQPQGTKVPIFFFPGVGGHPKTFAAVAGLLGDDQPCYGLTVPGLSGEQPYLTTVEAIATSMVANIRLVQPKGPYQFAGYCFGGLLAYEAARQFTAAGETVALLAVYDTYTPRGFVIRPKWQKLILHAYLLLARPGHLRTLRQRLQRRRTEHDNQDNSSPTTSTEAAAQLTQSVREANLKASEWYTPQPYPGSVLLFRAKIRGKDDIFYKRDPNGGWPDVAAGGVEIVDIPGTHYTLLVAEQAPTAAEALRPYLVKSAA